MGESHKPRKQRKQREMNPIKLVMDRGTNVEERWQRQEDGTKVKVPTAWPKGVVLGPIQTLTLATFIQTQDQTIQQLESIIEEYEQEADEADEADADA